MIGSSSRLDSFFAELRQSGMHIGPVEIARVNAVLFALEADRRMPEQIEDLASFIAPLLCRSASEQREFVDRFPRLAQVLALPDEIEPAPLPPVRVREITNLARWLRQWRVVGLAAISLLLVGAVVTFLLSSRLTTSGLPASPAPLTNGVAPATPSLLTLLRRNAPELAQAMIAIAPVPVFCFWWRSRRRRFAALERRFRQAPPALITVPLPGRVGALVADMRLRAILPRLRARRMELSTELDIEATIAATLRTDNLVTPVYAKLPREPEYLLLVNRASPRDLSWDLGNQLATAMTLAEIRVSLWEYNGDPRVCVAANRSRTTVLPIEELSARYGDHRLLIFTEGVELLSPLTGRVWPWITLFEAWDERYVLTLKVSALWGPYEAALAEAGFTLFEASNSGLSALAEHLVTGDEETPGTVHGGGFDYAAALREDEHVWLSEAPENAVENLRRQLGVSGFEWLAACAVFPMLLPELTQYLGKTTSDEVSDAAQQERTLFELARLPWFRHGLMPNVLRLELIHALSLGFMKSVEQALRGYLVLGAGGSQLQFAREDEAVWRRIIPALLRERFYTLVGHDYLFLAFMTGRRPSRLVVRAPQWLQALVVQPVLLDLIIGIFVTFAASILLWVSYGVALKPVMVAIARATLTFTQAVMVGLAGLRSVGVLLAHGVLTAAVMIKDGYEALTANMGPLKDILWPIVGAGGSGALIDFVIGKAGQAKAKDLLLEWWVRFDDIKWKNFGREDGLFAVFFLDKCFGRRIYSFKRIVSSLSVLCICSIFWIAVRIIMGHNNTEWCTQCNTWMGFTGNIIFFMTGFNLAVEYTRLIAYLTAKFCGIGVLNNLAVFIMMLIFNYLMLVYWPPFIEATKPLFALLLEIPPNDALIVTALRSVFKVFAFPLYPPGVVGAFKNLFSGESTIYSFSFYTSSTAPSIFGLVLSIIFVGSFLAKPLVLRPVSRVWARIVESDKPVFTLIFGGVAALASAIIHVTKHL
jgi:hypothetical protein